MAYIIRFSDGSATFEISAPTSDAARNLAISLRKAEAKDVGVWTLDGQPAFVADSDGAPGPQNHQG